MQYGESTMVCFNCKVLKITTSSGKGFVSTSSALPSPEWEWTRCPEEWASNILSQYNMETSRNSVHVIGQVLQLRHCLFKSVLCLIWGCVLLNFRSPNGCCSISHDLLSCSVEDAIKVKLTPSLLASTYFGTFWSLVFNILNYIVWLRITDEGSVPEMRIWSISLI